MPKRTDLEKILVIGSGPIQIGQACEFDYSGTQALRALKAEGYQLVLVNSNPATIMTDPDLSDATYIEPLIPEVLEKIIEKERPDALLPTLGGQVALNLAVDLYRHGVLDTYGVEVLGARIPSIQIAEDRERFKALLEELSIPILRSRIVRSQAEGLKEGEKLGFPLILRPSYTLGGAGGGVVYNKNELSEKLREAVHASPTSEVLMEESVQGWKEIELEVMCDRREQMVVVCTIENLDPMGIHTGDSITVAPAQTLTDKELQRLREAAKQITRGVGIQTGGCNIQFALDPESERWVVVEMNPRVSRSSALASKATGFPIAKIAALLAVGYGLDELQNDITRQTVACFEPALDYVVVKIPRFTFEKFEKSEPTLGTQMKSVGEVMALGRSFTEAFHKAINSLETSGNAWLLPKSLEEKEISIESVRAPRFDRWWLIAELLRKNKASIKEIHEVTSIDLWFLQQFEQMILFEKKIQKASASQNRGEWLRDAKVMGYSDRILSQLSGKSIKQIEGLRKKHNIHSQLNQVDTCAGEFEAVTPYYYMAYERFPASLAFPSLKKNKTVAILGSGPNRIGQGVEFDYCCVKAVEAVREMGMDAVMINCNPETVSTDYDVSSRLYFEPLEREYVKRVLDDEENLVGLVCQTGGQTALKLSQEMDKASLLGTSSQQIDRAEDRAKFDRLLQKLKLKRPVSKTVQTIDGLKKAVKAIGYPVLVRPSYVLGGRSMKVIRSDEALEHLVFELKTATDVQWPVLVDRFLEEAIEVDVDVIGDGSRSIVLAIMEHIEEAGIHSGDSACSLPAATLSDRMVRKIQKASQKIAKELEVCGFLNIQFAIWKKDLYVLEVNPRASRTIPFVCKATGFDWVKAATKAMLGVANFKQQALVPPPLLRKDFSHFSVKEVVFPFLKFPGVDVLLGPEMKSTGEVMGWGKTFQEAYLKGLLASNHRLPKEGTVFISVRDGDKKKALELAREVKRLGFRVLATHGTAGFFRKAGIVASGVNKVKEGQPHIVDEILNGNVHMVINTTEGESAISDSFSIRRSALQSGVPYFTTLTGARAAVFSLEAWLQGLLDVHSLQTYHGEVNLNASARRSPMRASRLKSSKKQGEKEFRKASGSVKE